MKWVEGQGKNRSSCCCAAEKKVGLLQRKRGWKERKGGTAVKTCAKKRSKEDGESYGAHGRWIIYVGWLERSVLPAVEDRSGESGVVMVVTDGLVIDDPDRQGSINRSVGCLVLPCGKSEGSYKRERRCL